MTPRLASLAVALAGVAAPLAAQAPALRIGTITSEKSCTVYKLTAGRSAMVASPFVLAAASSWREWLVRDCVDNFAAMRTSLEAALGGAGGVSVRPGARYIVSGRISDVGDSSTGAGGADYAVASRSMFVNLDVTVKDGAGRVVFGGMLTKRMETGSSIDTPGFHSSSSDSGQALYTKLQHEVALAAARMVAFHFTPLVVTGGGGRQVQLNYGAPLLPFGTIVQVTSPDGAATARYTVRSAGDGQSTAVTDGGSNLEAIVPGSRAVVLEADDPAANGRRFDKVDLP